MGGLLVGGGGGGANNMLAPPLSNSWGEAGGLASTGPSSSYTYDLLYHTVPAIKHSTLTMFLVLFGAVRSGSTLFAQPCLSQ